MKQFTFSFLCFLLASAFSLSAQSNYQHTYREVTVSEYQPYFKVGDNLYESDLRGLGYLMSDTEHSNPELFDTLLPNYTRLKRKKRTAVTIWVASSATSLGLILTSLLSSSSDLESMDDDNYSTGVYFTSGAIIGGVGLLVAALVYPNKSDYYNFVNQFNNNSKDKKIEWKMGLYNPTPKQLGLTLSMRF